MILALLSGFDARIIIVYVKRKPHMRIQFTGERMSGATSLINGSSTSLCKALRLFEDVQA